MQLNRLEIKGFKSFADKVVIHFDKGITGIVGPNGCGKSNVVDSFRWVLGEQKSRLLRSDKMENIIFNGSRNRKQTQRSEVSLTFDNTKNIIPTEYNQVTVTRRFYRSGESEYMLNGIECRLKDISNLFLDTGITSNSYAIIELNMVDDILKDKDNSRRMLFEEASGISKYRIRKKETMRKMEGTDSDLDRLEDLIFEIEKNLKLLEKQKKQSEKYKKLKEKYKYRNVALAKKIISQKQDKLNEIEKQIQKKEADKTIFIAEITKMNAEIEQEKTSLESQEAKLSSAKKELNDCVDNTNKLENEKKIKNERKIYLQEKIETLQKQLNDGTEEVKISVQILNELNQKLQSTNKNTNKLQLEVEGHKKKFDEQKQYMNELNQKLAYENSIYLISKDELYKIEKKLEIGKIKLNDLNNDLDKIGKDSNTYQSDVLKVKNEMVELESNKEAKDKELIGFLRFEDVLKMQIQEKNANITYKNEQLITIRRKLDATKNELNLTQSMIDNLEGFPETIKFLKKNEQWKHIPLLSDILTCPQEFSLAIENYLDAYMNYFIVNDQVDALHAIKLLRDANKGKASFFILNSLQSVHPNKINRLPNTTHAMEVIAYEQTYHPLIYLLLNHVFISQKKEYNVNDLENLSEGAVLLNKQGNIIFQHHAISGGSIGLFEGKKIGRIKNLHLLEKNIEQLVQEQESLQKYIATQKIELEALHNTSKLSNIEKIKNEISNLNEQLISRKSKQEQYLTFIDTHHAKKKQIQTDIVQIKQLITDLEPQLAKKQTELNKQEEQTKILQQEITSVQSLLEKASNKWNQENLRYHGQLNEVEIIKKEIHLKTSTFETTKALIKNNEHELEISKNQLNNLTQKFENEEDELVILYQKNQKLEKNVNEKDRKYYEIRNQIIEKEKSLRASYQNKETVEQTLQTWQNEMNEIRLELQPVKERISIEFKIKSEEILKVDTDEFSNESEEDLLMNIEKLKQKMDNIGPINPMAEESYNEISERYHFITSQKKDLILSKESLTQTIKEIDEVAKRKFMESFEKIKNNFVKVFRTLFTHDDNSDLILLDPDNPLESSIDIIAKPKGKKPRSINQLSGGEKTLVALALLFAIYLLKPAPFCIFDEVDAPLDDSNIDKFNKIIREFSKNSQFLIVTHNKRTMACTDVMYGITMPEEGVSKVVPVDLRKYG